MTVYIVTDGEYSGYHIEGVFLDKDKAEYFRKFHTSENGEVETYDTIDDGYTIDVKTIDYYDIELTSKGMVKKCEAKTFEYIPGNENFQEVFYRAAWGHEFCGKIIANSAEEAIKIMQDKRAQWLAEEYGI